VLLNGVELYTLGSDEHALFGLRRALAERWKARQPSSIQLVLEADVSVETAAKVVLAATAAGGAPAQVQLPSGAAEFESTLLGPQPRKSETSNAWIAVAETPRGFAIQTCRMDAGHPTTCVLEPDEPLAAPSLTSALPQLSGESAYTQCHGLALQLFGNAPFARAASLVEQYLSAAQCPTPVRVRLSAAAHDDPDLGNPNLAKVVFGGARLPPHVIQGAVRSHYSALRACYEQGLARDPNLSGKLQVRFVISRTGAVSHLAAAPETSLPDADAVQCMLRVFEQMTFPEPAGGIVTVVYPIQFQPDSSPEAMPGVPPRF
jgi:hypothetical protein